MGASIKMELNQKLYLRDPEQTDLGRAIVKESITLLQALGFEDFTFKKLAASIPSTEASVYRYFENKHKLLLYLVSWYWNWLGYRIDYHTHHIAGPQEKLQVIIQILAANPTDHLLATYIDVEALSQIVVAEASKVYLTKEVEHDNEEGFFSDYKNLCHKIAQVVLQVNPSYAYPHALVSTLFETARKQWFFAQHLPSLTEVKIEAPHQPSLAAFLNHLALKAIEQA